MEQTDRPTAAEMFAPPPWPKTKAGWKPILISVLITALIGLTFFLYGLMSWNSQLNTEQRAHQTDVSALRTQLTQTQQLNDLLRARGDLFFATQQLDQRNFGAANERLQSATQLLQRVDPTVVGVDANQLTQLRQKLSSLNIEVASDFESQRAQLVGFAQQLDQLIPKRQ